jgi:hypothetical protein
MCIGRVSKYREEEEGIDETSGLVESKSYMHINK